MVRGQSYEDITDNDIESTEDCEDDASHASTVWVTSIQDQFDEVKRRNPDAAEVWFSCLQHTTASFRSTGLH